jgi:hypothetical protein
MKSFGRRFPLLFFSREEARLHVHAPLNGEKVLARAQDQAAQNYGLTDRQLTLHMKMRSAQLGKFISS